MGQKTYTTLQGITIRNFRFEKRYFRDEKTCESDPLNVHNLHVIGATLKVFLMLAAGSLDHSKIFIEEEKMKMGP